MFGTPKEKSCDGCVQANFTSNTGRYKMSAFNGLPIRRIYIYTYWKASETSESKRMWERKPSEKREKVGLFHTFIYCVENADYTPMLPYLPEHMRTRSPYSSRMTSGTLWMNLHSCLFVWRFYWYGILMFYFFYMQKRCILHASTTFVENKNMFFNFLLSIVYCRITYLSVQFAHSAVKRVTRENH